MFLGDLASPLDFTLVFAMVSKAIYWFVTKWSCLLDSCLCACVKKKRKRILRILILFLFFSFSFEIAAGGLINSKRTCGVWRGWELYAVPPFYLNDDFAFDDHLECI